MGDVYKEILVKQKKTSMDVIKKVLMNAAIILLAAAGIFFHFAFLLLATAGIFAFSYLSAGLDREYEYLYVNGDFDIDVIKNKQRRKRVASYPLAQLVMAAPVGSHDLDSLTAAGNVTTRDFSSGQEEDKVICLVYDMDKGREMALMNIDEDVIRDIRRREPRKVSRDFGIF